MNISDWITIISIVVGAIGIILTIYSIRANGMSDHNHVASGSEVIGVGAKEHVRGSVVSNRLVVGVALVLCCAVLWGCSHVLAKHIMTQSIDPFLAIFLRNFIAAITVSIFVVLMRPFSRAKQIHIALSSTSLFMIGGRALAGIFYFVALQYISATEAIALYKFNAISAFVITIFLLSYKVPKLTTEVVVIGIVVTICGVLITTIGGRTIDQAFSSNSYIGYVYIILAAICWSIFTVFSEKDEGSGLSKTDLVTRQSYLSKILLYSSLPALAIFLISSNYSSQNLAGTLLEDHDSQLSIIVLGILTGVIGIMYFEALKRISPILVTVVVSFEIIMTGVLEAIFIDLNITWHLVVGAMLIILGSILVARESEALRLSKNT